ncbi:MAG: hypothetical protein H8E42_01205 [Nitrospinae bacterium]|nr:hypothetical protein [Nitrospinota bacterium]MBL7020054.1 hypothetical protein [Nitrospinaceae bacterium]
MSCSNEVRGYTTPSGGKYVKNPAETAGFQSLSAIGLGQGGCRSILKAFIYSGLRVWKKNIEISARWHMFCSIHSKEN